MSRGPLQPEQFCDALSGFTHGFTSATEESQKVNSIP